VGTLFLIPLHIHTKQNGKTKKMTEEKYDLKESGYDQKAYLQIRLHELLSGIDKLNFESVNYPLRYQGSIQKSIFKNLSSVFSTIYSKLTPDEKTEGKEERKKIRGLFEKNPISFQGTNSNGRSCNFNSSQNLDLITESLMDFRFLLEEFMDKHGFNPSKENAGVSIAKQ